MTVDETSSAKAAPLSATFHVTVETKPGGDYYVDHDDLVRNVQPWIEGGLDDRDDIARVAIRVDPPGANLVEQLNSVLTAKRPNPGCRLCSEEHTSAPCECGHDYHGHGRKNSDMSGRCLNCSCRAFVATDNYVRCGAWGGCPMPLGHNRGHSDIPENHQQPEPTPLADDHPAAYALAQYIAGHPMGTIMSAFRELGMKLNVTVEEVCPHGPERHGPEAGCIECRCTSTTGHETGDVTAEPNERCPQCGYAGACAGGPCPLLDAPPEEEQHFSVCATCPRALTWINCPAGGWWAHWNHPADGHDAVPTPGQHCSAGLMRLDGDPVERCVVHGRHRWHRTLLGEAWIPGEDV